ncbi:hypothetical protein [Spirochaeta dissipatitropha]
MKIGQFVKLYIFSSLGAALLTGSISIGALVWYLFNLPFGIAAVITVWLGGSILLFSKGSGGSAMIGERDRQRWQQEADRLESATGKARRLGRMRLPDPEMKRLAELTSIRAAAYYAECLRKKTYDPAANNAIEESVEIADAWLGHRDQLAGARHFEGLEQSDTESITERSRSLLQDRIKIIEAATLELSGGLTSADVLSIKEELEL